MKKLILLVGLFTFISTSFAGSTKGIGLTYPLLSKDPENLNGWRGSLWYQPQSLMWSKIQIYLDGSFGHWWVNDATANRQINIYSLAPVVRFLILPHSFISPYSELSIGLSYLTQTRIDHRNLGMHFSFQDQIAVGATLGVEKRLSISLSSMHYSNGSLSDHNSGITIPLLINVGYRF